MTDAPQFQVPAGLVVMTTHGLVTGESCQSLMDMRSFCDQHGLQNVVWRMVPGALVDKARNDAVREMLRLGAGYLLMVDADMTWAPDALYKLLQTAYGTHQFFDAVGAYCPLRGELALPTIDTGTGTWESHYPNSGVLEVIRTGGAFLLVKRHVFERLQDPWFRMRVPARPVDFMAEIDNFARIKFDGKNPFRDRPDQAWEKLEACALQDPSANPAHFTPAEVGEDSGFCDRVKLAGMRIAVDTNVSCGHVERRITTWVDHKKAMQRAEEQRRLVSGLLA